MIKQVFIVAVVLAALSLPEAAHACSCAKPRPCESFWSADTVFIGRAQTVVKKSAGVQEAHLVVEEWLRGQRAGGEMRR
jgi:hypothetical protein